MPLLGRTQRMPLLRRTWRLPLLWRPWNVPQQGTYGSWVYCSASAYSVCHESVVGKDPLGRGLILQLELAGPLAVEIRLGSFLQTLY